MWKFAVTANFSLSLTYSYVQNQPLGVPMYAVGLILNILRYFFHALK